MASMASSDTKISGDGQRIEPSDSEAAVVVPVGYPAWSDRPASHQRLFSSRTVDDVVGTRGLEGHGQDNTMTSATPPWVKDTCAQPQRAQPHRGTGLGAPDANGLVPPPPPRTARPSTTTPVTGIGARVSAAECGKEGIYDSKNIYEDTDNSLAGAPKFNADNANATNWTAEVQESSLDGPWVMQPSGWLEKTLANGDVQSQKPGPGTAIVASLPSDKNTSAQASKKRQLVHSDHWCALGTHPCLPEAWPAHPCLPEAWPAHRRSVILPARCTGVHCPAVSAIG